MVAGSIIMKNGVLTQQGQFSEGKEIGEWRFFNKKGQLEFIGDYLDGVRVGTWYKVSKSGKRKPIELPEEIN